MNIEDIGIENIFKTARETTNNSGFNKTLQSAQKLENQVPDSPNLYNLAPGLPRLKNLSLGLFKLVNVQNCWKTFPHSHAQRSTCFHHR